jgi:hypothetical protein
MGAAVLVFKFASKSLNQGYGALKSVVPFASNTTETPA